MSLKTALERLIGGSCYHGSEVFTRPSHVESWNCAALGKPIDWHALFDGFTATVDWPASAFWEEISEEFPEAIILLSTRESADSWWRSVNGTIFRYAGRDDPVTRMYTHVLGARFTASVQDAETVKTAYMRHNAHVRATAPPGRLVEWTPEDGWAPLCEALGVAVPDEPFPRLNRTRDRGSLITPEAIGAAGIEWAGLVEELMPHVKNDTPGDNPRVRALLVLWEAVGAVFHGGDERTEEAVQTMLWENRAELGRRLFRPVEDMDELFGYLARVR